MEDKMIQQFDRAIEQAMNNYTEAPPFGMWNRISAELGEPAPAVAPNNAVPSWINTGSVVGFLSGALLIGGLVIGNLIYNKTQFVASEQSKKVSAPLAAMSSIEEEPKSIETAMTVASATVKLSSQKTMKPKATVAANTEPVADKTEVNNDSNGSSSEVVVAENNQRNFYFPPVDIETGSATHTEPAQVEVALPQMQHTTIYNEANLKSEEKAKSSSSTKDQRLMFRPKKKRSHTYGHINRSKSKNR